MGLIQYSAPWDRQPPQGAPLDLSHPLIGGRLRAAQWGASQQTGVAARPLSFVGAPSQQVLTDGPSVRVGPGFGFDLGPVNNANSGWTIASIVKPISWDAPPDRSAILTVREAGGGGAYDRALCADATGRWQAYLFDGAVKTVSSAATVAVREYRVVVTTDGATLWLYVDGALQGSVAVSNDGFQGYTTPVFYGVPPNNTTTDVTGSFYIGRPWSARDVASWTATPWQLFAPQTRRIFTAAAGGAGLTLGSASSTSATSSSGATLAQRHLLSAASSAQASSSSGGALGQQQLLGAAASTQASSSSATTLAQRHLFGAAASTQASTSTATSITLGTAVVLGSAASAHACTSSAGTIVQRHVLLAAASVQDSIAAGSALVQAQMLGLASSVHATVSTAGGINDEPPANPYLPGPRIGRDSRTGETYTLQLDADGIPVSGVRRNGYIVRVRPLVGFKLTRAVTEDGAILFII